jgi:molecular chaperone DnaK (HSP70)
MKNDKASTKRILTLAGAGLAIAFTAIGCKPESDAEVIAELSQGVHEDKTEPKRAEANAEEIQELRQSANRYARNAEVFTLEERLDNAVAKADTLELNENDERRFEAMVEETEPMLDDLDEDEPDYQARVQRAKQNVENLENMVRGG